MGMVFTDFGIHMGMVFIDFGIHMGPIFSFLGIHLGSIFQVEVYTRVKFSSESGFGYFLIEQPVLKSPTFTEFFH